MGMGASEKNGPLNANEFYLMKKHTFYSFRIIERIPELKNVNQWASYHHERIDGGGYPFRLRGEEIELGSRIMAVCDVFTALTEKRPYRNAMPIDSANAIMSRMVEEKHLDGDVLSVLKQNIDEINRLRLKAQNIAVNRHRDFQQTKIL